jgi:type I restriction enzyme S subunit
VFASFLVRIKPINSLFKSIIGLAMTSNQFLNYIQMNAGGSAQPQANPPLLGEYEFQIPDNTKLDELNMQVEKIYSEISMQEQEIIILQELKRMVISRISRM